MLTSSASDLFIKRITKIEYYEEEFNKAKKVDFHWDSIDSAIAELILYRMPRAGMKKDFSWSKRLRGGKPEAVNAWNNFKKNLPDIVNRLKNVIIHCLDVTKLLEQFVDKDNYLIYEDPPYVKDTRVSKEVYSCEMTDEEHMKLADVNNRCKCKVIISAYDSPMYRCLYKNWNWVAKEVPNHSGQTNKKTRRIEWLIKNY